MSGFAARNNPLSFTDDQDLIYFDVDKLLYLLCRRPLHLDHVHEKSATQSEMKPEIAL